MTKTVWFTSDTHFGHKNIIEYCKRPFQSVSEMNETLVRNWNAVVKSDDVVWHLGDFAFAREPSGWLLRLNGEKHLIRGNHDKNPKVSDGWAEIRDYKELFIDDQMIVLSHYAMRVWNKQHYRSWMLYGHSHGSLPDDPNLLSIDIGVDAAGKHLGYRPLTFAEIAAIMALKSPKQVDHHKFHNRE